MHNNIMIVMMIMIIDPSDIYTVLYIDKCDV